MAGRVSLIKSVTSSIPIFHMQNNSIPQSIIQEFEKAERKFLWGEEENKRKLHTYSWEVACTSKENGGLGIRKLTTMNRALICKTAWNLFYGPNNLCSQVIANKYHKRCKDPGNIYYKTGDSRFWKAISNNWDFIQSNTGWEIRNGSKVLFWLDDWVPTIGPLILRCICSVNEDLLTTNVAHYVQDNEWKLDIIQELLPFDIVTKIMGMVPPIPSDIDDRARWKGNKEGVCTTTHAYQLLEDEQPDDNQSLWNKIWKLKFQQRLKLLLWRITRDNLPTRKKLSSQGLGTDICPMCRRFSESTLHIFRDCVISHEFWSKCVSISEHSTFFNCSLKSWVEWNIQSSRKSLGTIPWLVIFDNAVSTFWMWRNQSIFEEGFETPSNPIKIILSYAEQYWSAVLSYTKDPIIGPTPIKTGWVLPPMDWHKINTDGSTNSDASLAGCGGIARNHQGNWIGGFHSLIGNCSVLDAELWGIYRGLMFAKKKGLQRVIIETDSMEAIDLIEKAITRRFSGNRLVGKIYELSTNLGCVIFNHCNREANNCADRLARNSLSFNFGVTELASPPRNLVSLIARDLVGLPSCPREPG
ncbi:ribonuclease H [Senna tora]|uniref:Ribonuclease H n=1 Tax=Senna tora TaxID=362788 RepID=A0A834SEL7_9FABA|nr:ribonuclease H [Senna tora]